VTEAPVALPAGLVPGSWHEAHAEIAAGALTQLRVSGADHDRGRIESKVPAALIAIDLDLELRAVAGRIAYEVQPGHVVVTFPAALVPASILEAAVQLTVELYRRKDASFGVLNAWSPTGEALRISRDQLAGVDSLLAPFREGWGIG
jgi:hypothetical protein